jgi:arginyl-tRNA synthetase
MDTTGMAGQDGPAGTGIIAREADTARAAISAALAERGLTPRGPIDIRPVPFSGTWGVASSVAHQLAGELAMAELAAAGKLEGLSKKEAKQLAGAATRDKAQALAMEIAEKVGASNGFARVEAANGFVNVYFDANAIAGQLIATVLSQGESYGHGEPHTERVLVEHSQLNTHKSFHIGHLRNTCIGVAVSNIEEAAGYPVLRANYPGDIGMHVVKCLWCYLTFHKGQEPADPMLRGRWLGRIYAESDRRLNIRKEALGFLHLLAREDKSFVNNIDRLLKYLWRTGVEGEDIAYLLGRVISTQEIDPEQLRDPEVIAKFWPIVGDHLKEVVERPEMIPAPVGDEPEPSTTPEERLEDWQELAPRIGWFVHEPQWREEVRRTFQRWERKDPEFVALWQETREWSLADFRRSFDELAAHFDVWFFESEVEDAGREIVRELVKRGIAEIGDGGVTVVKIDEKLGLKEETYRTLPILRSDGTTLYSTKDLELTRRKFEDFQIDRAIWVVDVGQSLYFDQVFKILELWGFEQVRDAHHLSYEKVVLPEGVISSRKGNAPEYEDVRDMTLARAREIIAEKNPEMPAADRERVAKQVGLGSLKYAMLARDFNKVVTFRLEEALSFDGHAAPYIQYAHARACRILENAPKRAKTVQFTDLAPEELTLLQLIAQLPDDVQRAAAEFKPLLIANYVYELAKAFSDFYHACPVLQSEEPVRSARLALVDATRQTLANGLALLGIEAPTAM